MARRRAETERFEREEAERIKAEMRSNEEEALRMEVERRSATEEDCIDAYAARLKQIGKPPWRRQHGSKRRGVRTQQRRSAPKCRGDKRGSWYNFLGK